MAMIVPTGSPDYVGKINALVGNMRKNTVGQIVLGGLAKDVAVVPIATYYDPVKKQQEPAMSCRAVAVPVDGDAASAKLKKPNDPDYDSRRDRFYKGNLDRGDDEMQDKRFEEFASRVPTGLGSKSNVYFTPGVAPHCKTTGWSDPEIVLFHELVHAVRHTQGLNRAVPTNKVDWSNEEEFLAVVIENVYSSARSGKKAALRYGHGDQPALWPGINDSKGFVDERDHFDVLKHHADWHVFKELAKLDKVVFNPFYEFDRRAKAKAAKPGTVKGRK
jgi:hypothetical protein